MDTSEDSWTVDAIRTLCELHIPKIKKYNSGDMNYKRKYWKEMQTKMVSKGFSGETFNSSEKINRKWRYIFSQYKKVKDNNGNTGRNRMRFRHFETMHSIFLDQQSQSVLAEPQFVQTGEPVEGGPAKRSHSRTGANAKASRTETMLENYHQQTLELQREALELDRQKVDLLRQFLERS